MCNRKSQVIVCMLVALLAVTHASVVNATQTANNIPKYTASPPTTDDSVIYQSGTNVGIGTTSPSEKLHVSGGGLRIDSANVPVIMGETDQTLPRGLWRTVTDAGTYRLDRNTDPAGNFATFASPFIVWWDGATMFLDGNVGIGTSAPTEKLTVRGNILVERSDGTDVLELGDGLDFAEGFDVTGGDKPEPGAVLVIDSANPGELTVSTTAYDTKVAGIVAGANNLSSGVRLGVGEFDCDVALAGRVYCNVDATECAVEPGDLLTTSSVPGYAMKAVDRAQTPGAVLGKAMQSLEKGQKGQVLVLVTLQ